MLHLVQGYYFFDAGERPQKGIDMEKSKITWLSLQHFADGGEGAGSAGEMGTATGEYLRGDADRGTGENASADDLSDVIYGIGEDGESVTAQDAEGADPDAGDRTAEGVTGEPTEVLDPDAEFDKLISKDGKFRDAYNKRVRNIVSARMRAEEKKAAKRGVTQETAPGSADSEAVSSVFAELARKYKLDAGDTAGIAKAFLEDGERIAEEALARGMSVDEMKRVKATERELEAHKSREKQRELAEAERARQMEAQKRGLEARRRYDGWVAEGEAMKKLYPSFDLGAEAKNPDFVKALRAGMSVKAAYEGIHHDDLVKSAMVYTADKVEKGTADKIRANASRPVEGAAAGRSAVVHKANVNDLTGEDIREILKRVERGENIRF